MFDFFAFYLERLVCQAKLCGYLSDTWGFDRMTVFDALGLTIG